MYQGNGHYVRGAEAESLVSIATANYMFESIGRTRDVRTIQHDGFVWEWVHYVIKHDIDLVIAAELFHMLDLDVLFIPIYNWENARMWSVYAKEEDL